MWVVVVWLQHRQVESLHPATCQIVITIRTLNFTVPVIHRQNAQDNRAHVFFEQFMMPNVLQTDIHTQTQTHSNGVMRLRETETLGRAWVASDWHFRFL